MSNWKEYYMHSSPEEPSIILKRFFDMELDNGNSKIAIDLGCGAGRDTIYLLQKGYKVTAVDQEEVVIDIIKSKVTDDSNIDFIIKKIW